MARYDACVTYKRIGSVEKHRFKGPTQWWKTLMHLPFWCLRPRVILPRFSSPDLSISQKECRYNRGWRIPPRRRTSNLKKIQFRYNCMSAYGWDTPSPRLSYRNRCKHEYLGNKDKMRTWRGTAISVATKADIPRKALFAATAVDDRPTLASTMYAKELE